LKRFVLPNQIAPSPLLPQSCVIFPLSLDHVEVQSLASTTTRIQTNAKSLLTADAAAMPIILRPKINVTTPVLVSREGAVDRLFQEIRIYVSQG
ncbi:hypothetical protein NXF25_009878, partial [Crotalus adamanteus]